MARPGLYLVGLLAGIGFTMSIFIATLALQDGNLLSAAKLSCFWPPPWRQSSDWPEEFSTQSA
ncbi:Na+/H+ antiporter NhaA [Cupriavidus necator]